MRARWIPWRSSLTSLDLNLLIFSRSPPAFLSFFTTSANTKGATDAANLGSTAYVINPLKQQLTGCFWSLWYFFHLQQDAWLGLYFCLIDSASVPSHAEGKTEKTWPSGSSSHPAHHLNAAGEGSESKTCKQAPAKFKKGGSVAALARWEFERKKEAKGWRCGIYVWRDQTGELEAEIRIDDPSVVLLQQKRFPILSSAINLN